MDDRARCADQALEGRFDEVAARLGEHLDRHVAWNPARLDEAGDEIELGRARAGETDLDFLEPNLDQQIEEAALPLGVHRVDQRLIAVAHVGGKPAWRRGDDAARPLSIGQIDLGRSEEHKSELQSLMRTSY